MLARVVIDF